MTCTSSESSQSFGALLGRRATDRLFGAFDLPDLPFRCVARTGSASCSSDSAPVLGAAFSLSALGASCRVQMGPVILTSLLIVKPPGYKPVELT